MKKKSTERLSLAVWGAVVMAVLLTGPVAQADDAGKAAKPTPVVKAAKKGKKAAAEKKDAETNKGPTCTYGGKKWREGEHCMTKCNEQGSVCDMSICKGGEWKSYSSCFGPKAVMHNCPAACE